MGNDTVIEETLQVLLYLAEREAVLLVETEDGNERGTSKEGRQAAKRQAAVVRGKHQQEQRRSKSKLAVR